MTDAHAEGPGLTENEVRAVVRLLAEALSPNDGRAAKCRRVMDGLCDMAGADAWLWYRSRVPGVGQPPVNIDFCYGRSFGQEQMAIIAERGLEVHGEPPEYVPLKRLIMQGKHVTRQRAQLVDDRVWHHPDHRRYVERMGLDDHLYSIVPWAAPSGEGMFVSVGMIFRSLDRPKFERHVARRMHRLFGELGPLHHEALSGEAPGVHQQLTPRLRTLLVALVDGLPISQIAREYGLSPHTVNGYMKKIYAHFGVQSRAELMRRFMTVTSDGGGVA